MLPAGAPSHRREGALPCAESEGGFGPALRNQQAVETALEAVSTAPHSLTPVQPRCPAPLSSTLSISLYGGIGDGQAT